MHRKIKSGLYLVADPAEGIEALIPKLSDALRGGVDIVQLWNHWAEDQDKIEFISAVCDLAHRHNVPVLINEEWECMINTELDGVHFDNFPENIEEIRSKVDREISIGLTCGNDLDRIKLAVKRGIDYISFCSMFPSASVGDACEIVQTETVEAARQITDMPIFVSGGITTANLDALMKRGINGAAVISGILKAEKPEQAAKAFKKVINKYENQF
jgi:thiamine-phosphate pyrophosphorylase